MPVVSQRMPTNSDGNMTYYARRYYGRTQTAQIVVNGRELSAAN